MSEADHKKRLESEGNKISNFKQPGSCYEIYFNPVDGSVVKEEIE